MDEAEAPRGLTTVKGTGGDGDEQVVRGRTSFIIL